MSKSDKKRTVYILVGPKGSGKTYIGELLQKQHNIPFLYVENIAIKNKGERSINDEGYIRDYYNELYESIKQSLEKQNNIVFESTGLTGKYLDLLCLLRKRNNVVIIKIHADLDLCIKRIKERDIRKHVDISYEQIKELNSAISNNEIEFDFEIHNSDEANDEYLSGILDAIIKGRI
jgi:shikimate kinase